MGWAKSGPESAHTSAEFVSQVRPFSAHLGEASEAPRCLRRPRATSRREHRTPEKRPNLYRPQLQRQTRPRLVYLLVGDLGREDEAVRRSVVVDPHRRAA